MAIVEKQIISYSMTVNLNQTSSKSVQSLHYTMAEKGIVTSISLLTMSLYLSEPYKIISNIYPLNFLKKDLS